MSDPLKDFSPALFISYGVALAVYGGTGLFGYLTYGASLIDPITLNIGMSRSGAPLDGLSFLRPITNAAVTLKLESQFPLYSATILIALERCMYPLFREGLGRHLLRTIFFVITTLLALLVQNKLIEVQAFTGCLFIMATCMTLPAAFYLKLCWHETGFKRRAAVVTVFIVGVAVQTVGSTQSLISIFTDDFQ